MKVPFKKITIVTAIGGAGILALGALAYAAGARVNTSRSIALGLYWTSHQLAAKGAYVLFCPPQIPAIAEARRRGYIGAGFCPSGSGYMMKKILAAESDAVAISDAGVSVNGELLAFSAPLSRDTAGRPLPRYRYAKFNIGKSELLLMSDVSKLSFDGRYFGPVDRSQIKAVIVPVITW